MTSLFRNTFLVPVPVACFLLACACHSEKKLARKHQDYMDRTYTSLKQNLTMADVSILRDTVKVIFPNAVMFDYNEATIRDSVLPDFKKFAGVLQLYSKTHMLIIGHTDSIGTSQSNMLLSERRADSARVLLIRDSVSASRLQTWGLGATAPIASNSTEEGRARNRRVEFIVLDNYKK